MSRAVRLSPRARWDLTRLANFLAERDPAAAHRMSQTLRDALASLAELPERTPLIDTAAGIRELRVKFGRYGYAIQYAVEAEVVLVAQIFHAREAR